MNTRTKTRTRSMVWLLAWLASAVVTAPAGAVVHDRWAPAEGSRPPAVIVELTAPPAAHGVRTPSARAVGAAASAQRARVRQRIVALENQHRAAQGLGASHTTTIIMREYGVVLNGFAATVSAATVAALESDPDVRRIVPDRRVEMTLDLSVPHVRAPEVWGDVGYRGEGTTIAVIDTGVDYTHPDLGGCFGSTCKVIGGYDFINGDGDPIDDQGHGTHVAATAAGGGITPGVAPAAHVLAYKVLDELGFGSSSDVIAGIERAADPDDDGDPSDHVTVISMSLGGGGDENDPISVAVDNATAVGVLSVVAAGNDYAYFAIGSPGTARTALTVGATDDADAIADFSSRGPTTIDYLLKPEITAPGVDICAATIPGAFPGFGCRDSIHASISGTSMATPHVSGAAALLRGLFPALAPAEVKAMLQQAAVPLGLDVTTGGAGRLDVRAAVDVGTILSPAPLNFGIDDTTVPAWTATTDLTVRNLGDEAKTYTFDVTAAGLPAGSALTVTPNPVVVGGNGAATVTVALTVDNAVAPDSVVPPYLHSGRLTAIAGAERQTVLVGFAKLPPPPPPALNDACDAATMIPSAPFSDSVDTAGSTTEPSDPTSECGCALNRHSVWYRFTAPANQQVTVDTYGSDYDTVVAVYSGECGSAVPVTCNDDDTGGVQSQLSFAAVAGTTYLIEVTSYCDSPGGALRFNVGEGVEPPPPPINDACTSPIAITETSFTDDRSVASATSDPTDPSLTCGCEANGASVWYQFTAPVSAPVHVSTVGSDYDTVLAVFTGACGGLEPAAPCNDDASGVQSEVQFDATAGTVYLIEVTSYCGGQAGQLHLAVETVLSGQRLTGKTLFVRDHAANPEPRKIVVTSRDRSLRIAGPSEPGDPSSVGGAILHLVNPTSGESATINLPGSRWKGLGRPAGTDGYRYADKDHVSGPCSKVVLRPGYLRAVCSGAGIDFSLDEPAQGSLGVTLSSGPASYCMLFGGTVRLDAPAVGNRRGFFKAANAPAPDACPDTRVAPSCEGLCGGSAGSCFCDAVCREYGDCCPDVDEFCPG